MNLWRRLGLLFSICLLPMAARAQYDPPAGYYDSAIGLNGTALKTALHEIIDGHTRFPYTSSSTDTWDILSNACEAPGNTANVLTIYKNMSMVKTSSTGPWQREHTWPNSYGFNDQTGWPAYTDCHMLRPSYGAYNSARGNKPFNWVANPTATYTVDGFPGLANRSDSQSWEVWPGRRGDIARMMFYAATRYNGDTANEPDLELTDEMSLIRSNSPYMGKLSVLLEWHAQDPPDNLERRANHVVYGYQRNRNPFVDHPEFVAAIWGGATAGAYSLSATTVAFGTVDAGGGPITNTGLALTALQNGVNVSYVGMSGDINAFSYTGTTTIQLSNGQTYNLPFRFTPPANNGQSYSATFNFTSTNLPNSFSVTVTGTAQAQNGGGTALMVELFAYGAGDLAGQGDWSPTGSQTGNNVQVAAGSLEWFGVPASTGNRVVLQGLHPSQDLFRALGSTVSSGAVYASFLVNVTATGSAGDVSTAKLLSFASTNNTLAQGSVRIRYASPTQYRLGISLGKYADNAVSFTSDLLSAGMTYYVIVKHAIVPGGANDQMQLWINATPGTATEGQGAQPGKTASYTFNAGSGGGTDYDTEGYALNGIRLEQEDYASAHRTEIDQIRVGTTYASVNPGDTPTEQPTAAGDWLRYE